MADQTKLRTDAVGLQRFGLGRKGTQPASLRDDARDLMLEETRAGSAPQPQGITHGSPSEIAAAFYAYDDEQKMSRKAAARQAAASGGAKPRGADAMPGGAREVSVPTRIYQQEVAGSTRLALEARTGFGERLVRFWSNHFSVAISKGVIPRIMAGVFEREAIRPHVFGRFEDMLIAVERHPAMLHFLDNHLSIGPNSPAGKRRGRGLNENLGREILELHTLGVSGGYTQSDVTSLARIITGWTVAPRNGALGAPGSFAFNARVHEPGAQTLLGKRYDQPGEEKGLAALVDLARQPATATFLATKLVRHFVSDTPPAAVVDDLTGVFRRTGGDLAAVSRALIENERAWSAEPAKVRPPQEFLIALFRTLGSEPEVDQITGGAGVMGQPIWNPPGPNGFPDANAAWISPEGLRTRIDVAARWGRRAAGAVADPRQLAEEVLGPLLTSETRQAIARADSKPQALTLLLMSPEFQWR